MSHVGGATCRMTPISRSALEMNPMPGQLFEGNPVGEGTKRRGTDTPMHLLETPAGSTHSLSRALRPLNDSRGKQSSVTQTRRGLTLLSQLCRDPAVGVRNGEEA